MSEECVCVCVCVPVCICMSAFCGYIKDGEEAKLELIIWDVLPN